MICCYDCGVAGRWGLTGGGSLYEPSVSVIKVTLVTEVSGNSVLSVMTSLHNPIVSAYCGSFKYANASCGWLRYPNF